MADGILNCSTKLGTFTLNGILLNASWVCARNFTSLFSSAKVRGVDILVPSFAGVATEPRRRTVTPKLVKVTTTGTYNRNGVYQAREAARWQTMLDNIEYLEQSLGLPGPGGGNSSVTATWTQPDGSVRSAPVVCETLDWPDEYVAPIADGVLALQIPSGRLT